jgi:flavorubredoxin
MHKQTWEGGDLERALDRLDRPTPLYEEGDHAIYWLGIAEQSAFRCNCYLLRDGDCGILIDPGSRHHFAQIRDRVAQIMAPESLTGMVICHQDPDVGASMVDWLALQPNLTVFTSPRTQVLLPYYGNSDYRYYDVEAGPEYLLPSGRMLRFIPAPFLHFAGAFTTYDAASRALFSGDIWGAIDTDWQLRVSDFTAHVAKMNLFHTEYMASNRAARGFLQRLEGLDIQAILPQHGSLIGPGQVAAARDYLYQLRCGTDIIYAGID